MAHASTWEPMSTGLREVAERARREPEGRFHSLAHRIDQAALERAYRRLRADAAVGVDGVTKEAYGERLEENLRDLHERLRSRRYRHQPLRRVHVPKEGGGLRPIAVSALEDKIVQGALREVLEAVYEQDFMDCSYGFRPGRSAHGAIRALHGGMQGSKVNWIVEADIASFFDSVDRATLQEILRIRIADGSLRRLIGKCLQVGVLEGESFIDPELGTPQGSALSPLLGNVYLHHVLDRWFEREVKPRMAGRVILTRYADDFVLGFERRDDAERVMAVLGKRLGRFGLALQTGKTRLVPFGRPPRDHRGKGPGTFDFLGFTWSWRRTRRGSWRVACTTRRARRRRILQSVSRYCRRHRHEPVAVQHTALTSSLRGHYNYFGVNGNARSLRGVGRQAMRIWFKWLNRRSQKRSFTWERFNALLRKYPLPVPRITVQIWGSAP